MFLSRSALIRTGLAATLALALGSVGCATSGDVSELNDRLDSIDQRLASLDSQMQDVQASAEAADIRRIAFSWTWPSPRGSMTVCVSAWRARASRARMAARPVTATALSPSGPIVCSNAKTAT